MKKYVITIVIDENHITDSFAELLNEIDSRKYYHGKNNFEICGLKTPHCEITDCYTEEYD